MIPEPPYEPTTLDLVLVEILERMLFEEEK